MTANARPLASMEASMAKTHELKTWPQYFQAVSIGWHIVVRRANERLLQK